jgi:transposase-like protein
MMVEAGNITRYSEELRKRIVQEIESGELSIAAASKEYGAPKASIKNWLSDYGRFKAKRNIVEVVMKSEKERIAELEKALADAHLKMRVYDEILSLAGKKYKVDLKKTFGTQQPAISETKDVQSKPSVKR